MDKKDAMGSPFNDLYPEKGNGGTTAAAKADTTAAPKTDTATAAAKADTTAAPKTDTTTAHKPHTGPAKVMVGYLIPYTSHVIVIL